MFECINRLFGSRSASKATRRSTVQLAVERLDERLVPSGVQESDPIIVFSVHETGTWAQDLNNGEIRKISHYKASVMDEGTDGHLYAAYTDGPYGTWKYDWYANQWTRLTGATATVLDAADDDTLVASYASGTFEWDGSWHPITDAVATDIAVLHHHHAFMAYSSGLWEWDNNVWDLRTPSHVVCMDAREGYLYASFSSGTFRIADDGGAWLQLTDQTAIAIAARSGDSAALSFDFGTYAWHHVEGWTCYSFDSTTQLHYEDHWGVIAALNNGTWFIHDVGDLGSGAWYGVKLTGSTAILL